MTTVSFALTICVALLPAGSSSDDPAAGNSPQQPSQGTKAVVKQSNLSNPSTPGVTQTTATVSADKPDKASLEKTPGGAQDNQATQEEYLFRYKFTPNQFVHYTTEHKATLTTRAAKLKETAQSETVTQKHFRVVAIDDRGNATLEMMIDRVKMTSQFNDSQKEEFDSQDSTKRPPRFQHVMNSVGKPTARYLFAPNGDLLNVVSSIAPQQPCGQIEQSADQQAADVGMQNFLVVFPQEPIQIAGEWKDTIKPCVNVTSRLKKRVTLLRRYRLESVKDGMATISLKTTILSPIREPMIQAQLIQREPKGTIVFDMRQGRIVSRETTVDKVVIGAAGPKSSMRAVSRRREELKRDS